MSKELATIYKEVPINITLDDIICNNKNQEQLISIYNELEFYSLIKKEQMPVKDNKEIEIKILNNLDNINITDEVSVYLDLDSTNYHNSNILGLSLYNKELSIYIPYEVLITNPSFLKNLNIISYDIKKLYIALKKIGIEVNNLLYDAMISGYLLNYNVKDDIAYFANSLGYEINFFDPKEKLDIKQLASRSIQKAKFIYETKSNLLKQMEDEEVIDLYNNIEFPLALVLAKMEYNGIDIDKKVLYEMRDEISNKIDVIANEIYTIADEQFNILSPKQLGVILFEKMKLPYGKKNKNGNYVTDEQALLKVGRGYPIINKILEYRTLNKLLATYIDGMLDSIADDGKIHTIYTQTLTRTGRLSSIEPNLQNIPIRNEYGRRIRKAFIPEDNSMIMSSDYSQIELRIFAHMSKVPELIEAFNNNMDIHTKTAMDIFNVDKNNVTPNMRRQAKAVNFGILYGISSYGLSEDLGISFKDAKEFIDKYYKTYPGIKDYMDKVVAKAHQDGYVKTIMNRKRLIEELNNSNYMIRSMGERMAMNTPIQGSSADILKKSMIEIDKEFTKRKLSSKMLLQVHDELIFNVLLTEKEEVANIVKEIMENTYRLDVPLITDIEFGSNWYEAK